MTDNNLPPVEPHASLDNCYEVNGWTFCLAPDEDGNPEYVRNAIEAWHAWAAFLERREREAGSDPLF